jgi:hypothetical protein
MTPPPLSDRPWSMIWPARLAELEQLRQDPALVILPWPRGSRMRLALRAAAGRGLLLANELAPPLPEPPSPLAHQQRLAPQLVDELLESERQLHRLQRDHRQLLVEIWEISRQRQFGHSLPAHLADTVFEGQFVDLRPPILDGARLGFGLAAARLPVETVGLRFVAADLLRYRGHDLAAQPFSGRRALLAQALEELGPLANDDLALLPVAQLAAWSRGGASASSHEIAIARLDTGYGDGPPRLVALAVHGATAATGIRVGGWSIVPLSAAAAERLEQRPNVSEPVPERRGLAGWIRGIGAPAS